MQWPLKWSHLFLTKMNTKKAKTAKKKAKKAVEIKQQGQLHPLVAQALIQQQMGANPLMPEVAGIGLGEMSDMQPADGMFNPMRPMGTVNPNYYNPGNVIGGF